MKKFYIQMFSIHGLLRSRNLELGRDADTGGQIKYVVELAETLSRDERVERVDLFTRLLVDKRVSADYGKAVEEVSERFRIIRIQCGGKRYVRKELLWPFLDEYVDKTIQFIKREGRNPDIVHGHYPDAGYVALLLSEYFGTPFVYTGHSMGHAKLSRLLAEGMREEEIVRKYHIDHRIEVEEEVIKNADLIVTSTSQEVETQYGMYRHHALARYRVMPPGINLDVFYPYQRDLMPASPKKEEAVVAYGSVTEELNRFFTYPDRPLILALCRADKRKNIAGLIHAYGTDKELRAIANLAIFAGIRKNIGDMEDNEKDVLTEMLLLMDRYDLYGRMAIPKKHDFTYEVPELYRITAERKGVFVNVALTEPFGLTLIEAAACGLPIVATRDGGPRDILRNCDNGVLVDPLNPKAIAKAIKGLLVDQDKWRQCSGNGIRGVNAHYNWESHVRHYLDELRELEAGAGRDIYKRSAANPVGDRLTRLRAFVITDIDDTLLGDDESLERLKELLAGTGKAWASAWPRDGPWFRPCRSWPNTAFRPRMSSSPRWARKCTIDPTPSGTRAGAPTSPNAGTGRKSSGSWAASISWNTRKRKPSVHSKSAITCRRIRNAFPGCTKCWPGTVVHATSSIPTTNSWISCPIGPPRVRRYGI